MVENKRYCDCRFERSRCWECQLSSGGRDCRGAAVAPLKYYREKSGLSMRNLAAAAGISLNAIVTAQNRERVPSAETLRKLADVLNCTIDDLYP